MGDKVFLLLFFLFLSVNGESDTSNPGSEKEYPTKEEDTKTTASDSTGAESNVQYVAVDAPKDEEVKEKPSNNLTSSEEQLSELKFLKDVMDDSSSDSSSDEIVDNEPIIFVDPMKDPLFPSSTEEAEVGHESKVSPIFERENTPGLEIGESTENGERLTPPPPRYEPANGEAPGNEPNVDSSPVLQLTQGGYRGLYLPIDEFGDQRQRLRPESATEQSERIETPESNPEQGERSRAPFQNPFAPFLQAPFTLASSPVFRHPFQQQQQGLPNRAIQNSFYNTQPEFNQQYSQLDNAGDYPNVHFTIQTAPRAPMQHHPFLFQTPFQFQPPHQVDPVRHMSQLFQTGGSPSYSIYDGARDSVAPDFTALFGSPLSQGLPQQRSPYGMNPNSGGNFFANQPLMSNFPNAIGRSQFSPRTPNQPLSYSQIAPQGRSAEVAPENEAEKRNESPVEEDSEAAPFGARLQKQNGEEEQKNVARQDNVFIRYPLKEAGYATEESLPTENETKTVKEIEEPLKQQVPFFAIPPRYNIFNGPDPYKIALENVQRDYPNGKIGNNEDKNDTKESQSEDFIRNLALGPNLPNPREPQIFRAYPERNQELSLPNTPFFPLQSSDRNTFEPVSIFPDNRYQYIARPPRVEETKTTPACASKTNFSLCFEDSEYPRGEIMYALSSDSFMMDRLVMPNQQLEGISLVELNKTEDLNSEDNYICKSDIKYGLPLRAKNIEGDWKVVVNIKRAIGRGKFVQPVRLEVCKGAGEPCSTTEPQTACVQKYSLQRLLSWSSEKGVHNDVYRLPVACSCQMLDVKGE